MSHIIVSPFFSLSFVFFNRKRPLFFVGTHLIDRKIHSWKDRSQGIEVRKYNEIDKSYLTSCYISGFSVTKHSNFQPNLSFPITLFYNKIEKKYYLLEELG